MTMGDEALFSNMIMPVLLVPILEKLEQNDKGAAQTLKSAFSKVENTYPGFSYDFVKCVMRKAEIHNKVDLCESLLRVEGIHDSEDLRITRPEQAFQDLNARARGLKKILGTMPDQISDRRQFLETIKEIASAIKHLLDSVNSVITHIPEHDYKQKLEHRKREFVRYSKRFSDTLKEFFKKNQNHDVFVSADYLVHQTNLMLREVKNVS